MVDVTCPPGWRFDASDVNFAFVSDTVYVTDTSFDPSDIRDWPVRFIFPAFDSGYITNVSWNEIIR